MVRNVLVNVNLRGETWKAWGRLACGAFVMVSGKLSVNTAILLYFMEQLKNVVLIECATVHMLEHNSNGY